MQINSNNSISFGCYRCAEAKRLLLGVGAKPEAVNNFLRFNKILTDANHAKAADVMLNNVIKKADTIAAKLNKSV